MKLQEKLDRETGQRIYLYKQGVFWTAYELSMVMINWANRGINITDKQKIPNVQYFVAEKYNFLSGTEDFVTDFDEYKYDAVVYVDCGNNECFNFTDNLSIEVLSYPKKDAIFKTKT